MKKLTLILYLGLFAFVSSAFAQDADPNDVNTIDNIMRAYYEVVSGPAGEKGDYERDKTLHHADAWIAIAGLDAEGKPTVTTMKLEDFYGDNAPREQNFFEWETDRQIRRSGNMVSVWSSYASSRERVGGEAFTRGVNTITLWWDGDRWWVMNWMFDTSDG